VLRWISVVTHGDLKCLLHLPHLLQTLLSNSLDLAHVSSVTTDDLTYVSLSENNPELKRFLPCAGTNNGPQSIVAALQGMGATWETKAFEIRDVIEQGDKVALFGSFTYRGRDGQGDHIPLRTAGEGTRREDLLCAVPGRQLRHLQDRASTLKP